MQQRQTNHTHCTLHETGLLQSPWPGTSASLSYVHEERTAQKEHISLHPGDCNKVRRNHAPCSRNSSSDRQTDNFSPDSPQISACDHHEDHPQGLPRWDHELSQRRNKAGNTISPASIDYIYLDNLAASHQADLIKI